MIHSYSSIHQIFYANKKFDCDQIIQLQKYCISNLLLEKLEREIPMILETPVITEKTNIQILENPSSA